MLSYVNYLRQIYINMTDPWTATHCIHEMEYVLCKKSRDRECRGKGGPGDMSFIFWESPLYDVQDSIL